MNIILLGYMSSGKTTVGKALARQLSARFIDLDEQISSNYQMSIPDMFQQKGELFFRKAERDTLNKILMSSNLEPFVLSLGGGTPCYYNNIDVIQQASNITSIYLKVNIAELLNRLWKEKENRPLIAHYQDKEGLEEFIRKHLFERQFYYLKSNYTLDVSNLNPTETIASILQILQQK